MAIRWAIWLTRAACLITVLFFAINTPAIAQGPTDAYQVGPDPIAPELSNNEQDTTSDDEAASSENEQNNKADEDKDKDDLEMLNLDLKQLSQVPVRSASPIMDMEVSTVNRTVSSVGKSPAAVYVITNEMIKRCGARNIPEALRLAPGVQVARVTTDTWAISIRGFNGVFANKLLVQIDGRAVYTPGTASVHWDQQQVLLEDVERIEIIRGPGASVWGANAVNGVINIVTKSSIDTHGIYAYSGGGNEHRSFNAVRAGGRQGDLNWRIYGMQADDGPGYWNNQAIPIYPPNAWDAFQFAQGGFHMDWTPTSRDTLTFQGDFFGGRETYQETDFFTVFQEPQNVRTSNFLGRWTRKLSDQRDWSVQLYYDGFKRNTTRTAMQKIILNTFDFDAQYHAMLGSRHDVVCGFGYRNYETSEDDSGLIYFNPPQDTFDIISYFIQDTITVQPDRWFLTAGIKLEHNDFTNFEYQPTIRLLFSPDDRTAIWGAVSRAVRTPAVNERDINFFNGLILGNRNLKSEDLIAYELGMRRQVTDKFYWDLAAYYNAYDNLIGVTPVFPVVPEIISNVGYGNTYGYELLMNYEVNEDWHLCGCYSFLVEDITYPAGTTSYALTPGLNPRNQFFLHSAWDLSDSTQLDMIWRYVDRLPIGVPHYFVMDVRLAKEFSNGLEVAVVGQNLLDNHHLEFFDFSGATEVQSGVYGMISWRH